MIVRRDVALIILEILVDIRFVLLPFLAAGAVEWEELGVQVIDAESLEDEAAAVDIVVSGIDLLRDMLGGREEGIRYLIR
jgi:hypothetical protein